jgi:hypothetical protein
MERQVGNGRRGSGASQIIRNKSKLQPWVPRPALRAGGVKNEKIEFNSPIFPVSRGGSKKIALRLGPANRAWGDMRDTGG